VPESIMPAYGWLERAPLRTEDLGLHLEALRKVGVPYTDEMIANAEADARGQAAPDSEAATGVAERYGEATTSAPSAARPCGSPRWTRWWPICRFSAG
jgi:cytochrome c oxidase cbb3-type subunit 2